MCQYTLVFNLIRKHEFKNVRAILNTSVYWYQIINGIVALNFKGNCTQLEWAGLHNEWECTGL